MTGFQGPKKVVISSRKYDIHKLTLNLDILNIHEIFVNLCYWQEICSQNSVKFGVDFRAYHSINRGSGNSIYQGLMPTNDTIKVALASLKGDELSG